MAGLLPESRRVGLSELSLPPFGLGTAHLGELYSRVDETDSRAVLDAAWTAGIRYFDTAPWYGRGLAEHRLGGFLRTRPREQFVVTTKVGRTLHRPTDPRSFSRAPWAGGLNFEVEFDYSHDGIMRAYEQALQRLALDTVDALVIHDIDRMFHTEEALKPHLAALTSSGFSALAELKAAGQIKAIGIGVNQTGSFDNLVSSFDVDFALVAMPYTLIDQASLHAGMATCLRRNISVVVGAPFASGILATGSGPGAKYAYGDASDEVQAKVRGLEELCRAHGVSLQAASLQFPLAHPAVASIIPGAAHPKQVLQNLASLEAPIPAGFWRDLKAAGLIVADAPTPGG